jgi:hypothetical protein
MPFMLAVMFALPVPAPVANPPVVIVATVGALEIQLTWLVRFTVLASVYVPVAVNWSVVPLAIASLTVLMLIDCNNAAVTLKEHMFDVSPPMLAVMTALPSLSAVANPLGVIAMIAGEAEIQFTWLVILAVLLSLYVPAAVNWPVMPLGREAFGVLMAMDFNMAAVTVTVVVPLIDPKAAITVELPTLLPLTSPLLAFALLTLASVVALQVVMAVRSLVLLSL